MALEGSFHVTLELSSAKRNASRKHTYIILTPLNPTFIQSNWGGGGFTGIYIIFLVSAKKHRLWFLVRTASSRRF